MRKNKLVFLLLTIFFLSSCKEKEVNVLNFKASSDNDQEMIQNAIDYAESNNIKIVFIPNGTYEIDAVGNSQSEGGVQLKNNIHLRLDENAILKALPNNSSHYSIVKLDKISNVKISGGIIRGEKDEHTVVGAKGEWGMGINILGSSNIEVFDITIEDCWGDGIYIGGSNRKSKNIVIENVICDKNRRQGISVVHCDSLIVRNSVFSKTRGTAPQAGIDIEPNIGQSVDNVEIYNCEFSNNTGPGFFIFAGTGLVSNVSVRNCNFDNNSHAGINLNGGKPLEGQIKNLQNVTLTDNITTNNPLIGLTIQEAKNIKVKNIKIKNCKKSGVRIRKSIDVNINNFLVENFLNAGWIIIDSESVVLSTGLISANKSSSFGIKAENSKDIQLDSLEVKGGVFGFHAYQLNNSIVTSSTFESQLENSVLLNETGSMIFKENSFSKSNQVALKLIDSETCIIEDNIFIDNGISKDNFYSHVSFEGTSNKNEFVNNTIKKGFDANKSKYVLLLDVQTSLNNILNNYIDPDSYSEKAIQNLGKSNELN